MDLRFRVSPDAAGDRLDRFLTQELEQSESTDRSGPFPLTRSQIKRAIDQGAATVDGQPARAGQRLKADQEVCFTPPRPEPTTVEPEAIPLDIAYEDDHLVVVNKAAGMVVHPSAGHRRGTLVAALLAHCRIAGGEDEMRPGVVHRLDRDTTGLLVVTKDVGIYARLAEQFRDHTVGRRYVALVRGVPDAKGKLDTLYGRHPNHRIKFSSRHQGSRRAVTHYEVLEAFGSTAAAMVACRLETGRTHQVRVHMSDMGHPILGDELYGGGSGGDHRLKGALARLSRQALHARHLAFDHPVTGRRIDLEAAPPQDFQDALAALRDID